MPGRAFLNTCVCGAALPPTGKRGRPRKSCASCTPSKPKASYYIPVPKSACESCGKMIRGIRCGMCSKQAPCAGGCGKMLWISRTSLAPGEATCRECRRREPRPYGPRPSSPLIREAVELRSEGYSYNQIGLLLGISRQSAWERVKSAGKLDSDVRSRSAPCIDCQRLTIRKTNRGRLCEECAGARRRAMWQRKNLKRRAGGGEPMTVVELAERDRWRCHLCRKRVDRRLRWPHPRSASRDHLVPVADGGTNDPANLALAHLECNVLRNTGGTVQLLLVG